MTFKYAVTFESMTLPPLTIRGEVTAGQPFTTAGGGGGDAAGSGEAMVQPVHSAGEARRRGEIGA